MLLAVYGTLRKGEGNYDWYMRGTPMLGEQRIAGFEMYNLGGYYPYIARGGDSITAEIYDVAADVFDRVERMERGAGYEVMKVSTQYGDAAIFYMPEERHALYQSNTKIPPKILSGDWFEWLRKYKPERLQNNPVGGNGNEV